MEVIVKGMAGEGKTTVCALIAQTLQNYGLTVEFQDQDGITEAEAVARVGSYLPAILKADLCVVVSSEQTERSSGPIG